METHLHELIVDPSLIVEFAVFELQEHLSCDLTDETRRRSVQLVIGLAVKQGVEAAKERCAAMIETSATLAIAESGGQPIDLDALTVRMADEVRQDQAVERAIGYE